MTDMKNVRNNRRKKVRNPLLKRIHKELLGDWRKYLLVSLFLYSVGVKEYIFLKVLQK